MSDARMTYPGDEGDEEESPLLSREHGEELEGIRRIQHRWLERCEARLDVFGRRHAEVRSVVILSGPGRRLVPFQLRLRMVGGSHGRDYHSVVSGGEDIGGLCKICSIKEHRSH